MTIALTILLLLFLLQALNKHVESVTPFDLAHTLPLRGILALLVVFGHLDTVVSSQTRILAPLHMATPAVAVFFFMSGYGLMLSYTKKGKDYLHQFVAKSTVKLLLPLLITTLLYQGILIILSRWSFSTLIDNFISGREMPLVHSWFVYALFLFYMLFFVFFNSENSIGIKGRCIGLTMSVLLYYIITRYCFRWDFFWWLTCLSFPMGIYYARFEDQVKDYISRYNWITIPIILLLLAIKLLSGEYTPVLAELPYVLIGPLVAILLYRMPLPTNNKILNFIGTLSFEIYLTHGIFESLLRNIFESPYLFIAVVVTMTIFTSWLLHILYKRLISRLLARLK